MRPFTESIPKCLVPVLGRPFLSWQLELLAKNNVAKVVLSTGYLGHKIDDYLAGADTSGIEVEVCHEKGQLGTGGAVINSLPLLPDEFFLIYGDSYLLEPFMAVHEAFKKSGKGALMSVIRQEKGTSENNCSVENGLVTRYAKKQPGGTFQYMDYGLLFFRKRALGGYFRQPFSADIIFAGLIGKKQLAAYEATQPYYEAGSPEGLAAFSRYLRMLGP